MAPEAPRRPRLSPDASLDQVCRPAPGPDLESLGLPPGLPPDWPQRLVEALGQALRADRGLAQALEACVGCGACAQACPFHAGTGDPHNTPWGRGQLARVVFSQHHSARARLGGQWGRPKPVVDQALLERWWAYFWQCSLCRRCASFCPLGIDTSIITQACRRILAGLGLAPTPVVAEARGILATGNGLGVSPAAWIARHQELEDELRRETGQDMACPVDEQGAQVLLIPSPREPFSQAATYKGYAKVFHAAGVSWTTSTYLNQADNPGRWLGPAQERALAERLLAVVRLLKPQRVLVAESGGGWAYWRGQGPALAGPLAGEGSLKDREILHICQYTSWLLEEGALAGRLRPQANQDLNPTYHDPCQAVRGGGLWQEPRRLLQAACPRLLEMPRPVAGPLTQCCGAGGGLMQDDLYLVRMAGLVPRARALAWASQSQGCNAVVTMCSTCQEQLREGQEHFGLGLATLGLHELLGQALYPSPRPEARP